MKKREIPYTRIEREGAPVLHFGHANGFPFGMYPELLEPLSERFDIYGMHYRPLWPESKPESLRSWWDLADDLIRFLDARQLSHIVGAGHSMGAVSTLLAAIRRPDLFSKIVLIDPVFLPTPVYLLNAIPVRFRKRIVPPAKIALKRRDQWESREEAFQHLRKKRVFSNMSDRTLRAYTQHGMKEADSGVTLSYSKEWEAHVYTTPVNPRPLMSQLEMPVLGIRGKRSDVLTDTTWERWKQNHPSTHLVEIEGGHLVPLEQPQAVAAAILDFI